MADDNKNQQGGSKEEPIIIKKKKGHGGHGHHGGAWKVAYADFVTAMMAFFIVMWILASSAEVKEQVTQYFNDPGAFDFMTGQPLAVNLNLKPAGPGKGKEMGTEGGDSDTPGSSGGFMVFEPTEEMQDSIVSKLFQKAMEDSLKAVENVKKMGTKLEASLNDMLSTRPDIEDLLKSIKIEMTKEGLRIELIESSESLFFEIGSSKLRGEAVNILSQLAEEIGKLPNNVELEGHTDSRSYGANSSYTNWDLSSERANSARSILESAGLWPGQVIKVSGFADKNLRNPENPFDIENRRVSILITHINSKDFLATESGDE